MMGLTWMAVVPGGTTKLKLKAKLPVVGAPDGKPMTTNWVPGSAVRVRSASIASEVRPAVISSAPLVLLSLCRNAPVKFVTPAGSCNTTGSSRISVTSSSGNDSVWNLEASPSMMQLNVAGSDSLHSPMSTFPVEMKTAPSLTNTESDPNRQPFRTTARRTRRKHRRALSSGSLMTDPSLCQPACDARARRVVRDETERRRTARRMR